MLFSGLTCFQCLVSEGPEWSFVETMSSSRQDMHTTEGGQDRGKFKALPTEAGWATDFILGSLCFAYSSLCKIKLIYYTFSTYLQFFSLHFLSINLFGCFNSLNFFKEFLLFLDIVSDIWCLPFCVVCLKHHWLHLYSLSWPFLCTCLAVFCPPVGGTVTLILESCLGSEQRKCGRSGSLNVTIRELRRASQSWPSLLPTSLSSTRQSLKSVSRIHFEGSSLSNAWL